MIGFLLETCKSIGRETPITGIHDRPTMQEALSSGFRQSKDLTCLPNNADS